MLAGIVIIALSIMAPEKAQGEGQGGNFVFSTFTAHIAHQMGLDKQAFAQASTCLSWFYKASKTPHPPVVQSINWRPIAIMQPETDCPRYYPGGMNAARDDFAKTQTLLSVSLTVYQFALVADQDDNRAYGALELQDLFHSLSLAYNAGDSPGSSSNTLNARFDQWYRASTLDEVMRGMSSLYERGYRVTSEDRAELDRIMK